MMTSAADSPLRFSALKTLTPEHRVDFDGLVLAPPPLAMEEAAVEDERPLMEAAIEDERPLMEATVPGAVVSPLESPKASEAVDSTEDDYVMLDAVDLILPSLHLVPSEEDD